MSNENNEQFKSSVAELIEMLMGEIHSVEVIGWRCALFGADYERLKQFKDAWTVCEEDELALEALRAKCASDKAVDSNVKLLLRLISDARESISKLNDAAEERRVDLVCLQRSHQSTLRLLEQSNNLAANQLSRIHILTNQIRAERTRRQLAEEKLRDQSEVKK